MVTEWVDQREILSHGSVEGFLSNCDWNSVVESICAAWPMMADQHLNGGGNQDWTKSRDVRGFVKWKVWKSR
ncbi:hypothetical protein KY284_013476 [Solanum tuberosum]|nr:hypothetical protein KY284_013476 [Solanum tuberosum]